MGRLFGRFLFCPAEKGAEKSSPNCWLLLLGCQDCQHDGILKEKNSGRWGHREFNHQPGHHNPLEFSAHAIRKTD